VTVEATAGDAAEAIGHRISTAIEMYLFQLEEASRACVPPPSLITSVESIAERLEQATEYLRLKTKEKQ
jgi:hypothetical protein